MKKINALFIGNSHMGRQELIIPGLMKPLGYEMTVETVYAGGQTFQGHVLNNDGILSDEQRDGIERGRIGGWWSEEHVAQAYDIIRNNKSYLDNALAARSYDVAFIIISGGDGLNPDGLKTFAHCATLVSKVKAMNPEIKIVFFSPWTYHELHHFFPQYEWLAKSLALEHGAALAPVGTAFKACEEAMPELFMYRSRKDSHQNEQSILLISYCQICAWLGTAADELDFSLRHAALDQIEALKGGVDSELPREIDELFIKLARSCTAQVQAELQDLHIDQLTRPVIETPDNGVTAINADHKILVIGNAWFDANGALWQELINTFHVRDEQSMHVECHCDDAATLQSIIANNAGELTQRQQDIMQHISNTQDRMDQLQLDHDRFDDLADYPVDRAFQFITDRTGKLDSLLQQDIPWDTVIVQGFRG
ncbi:MAG: hypothetical protein HRU15_19910, partial [Planctomycetes bacterium]|nr:hypothetical protein [Planctomycetota bacterium]